MLTILHISDLHFGPRYIPHVGEVLLREAFALEPEIIVVSGDFTQRAKREQFIEARNYLDRLPKVPIVVTPGNHDVPLYRVFERIFSPEALYRQYISDELDYVLHRDDAVIVSLNSTSPLRTIVNGRLERRQLEFAEAAFRAASPDAVRIVVTHHNLAPAPDYEGGTVMYGAERILRHLNRIGAELVFAGHLHRAYNASSLDLFDQHPPGGGIRVVQAGTSTSARGRGRERGRNSFNLVRVGKSSIRVTPYLYFDDLRGFAPTGHHVYPRGLRWQNRGEQPVARGEG